MAQNSMIVPPLSYAQIEKKAAIFLRQKLPDHYRDAGPLDIINIFDNHLHDVIGFDEDIQDLPVGAEGYTDFTNRRIVLATSTHNGLAMNSPRDRFTVVHEISHGILHTDYLRDKHVETAKTKNLKRGDIETFRDSEWQADSMAAAILMPFHFIEDIINSGGTYADIERIFKVSTSAAYIRFNFVKARQKKSPAFNGGSF